MNIIVCVKEVLDPDALNAFAVGGQLKIDQQTKQVVPEGIPLVMNGYDAQAIEGALRLRDQGHSCIITVLNLGTQNPQRFFQHAFAMGVDQAYCLEGDRLVNLNAVAVSQFLAKAIEHLGGADLILCGLQCSDDDQGVVGPGIAALLGLPCVTIVRDLQYVNDGLFRVVRVLPDGEEVVEVEAPVVATITNELGTPRFPTMRQIMEARKKRHGILTVADLGIESSGQGETASRVRQVDLALSEIQGSCEFIQGDDVRELAASLAHRLRADRLI